MSLVWSPTALADLHRIEDYIAERNPRAAGRMTETIRNAVRQLERFPAMGRPGRISGTRELVVTGTPYIVPYRVRGAVIEIVAVMHGAQRWPDSL